MEITMKLLLALNRNQENVCAEACKIEVDDQSINRCLRKRKMNDTTENSKCKRDRVLYHSNTEFRQKKIESLKSKYCQDSDYRQKKIE